MNEINSATSQAHSQPAGYLFRQICASTLIDHLLRYGNPESAEESTCLKNLLMDKDYEVVTAVMEKIINMKSVTSLSR